MNWTIDASRNPVSDKPLERAGVDEPGDVKAASASRSARLG